MEVWSDGKMGELSSAPKKWKSMAVNSFFLFHCWKRDEKVSSAYSEVLEESVVIEL